MTTGVANVYVGDVPFATLGTDGAVNGYISWAAIAAPIVPLLWIFWRWLNWRSTMFVITTERLIFQRTGLFARYRMEIPLRA